MRPPYQISLDTYDRTAKALSQTYNALKSEDVLPGLAPRLPVSAGSALRALDLGCGSGRDAFWLAGKGFHVTAVDGAAEMIREAARTNSHPHVDYFVDLMPTLEKVAATGARFDLVVMSASWMHLDTPDRKALIDTLTPMLKDGGLVYISLRHGPAPADRPMFPVSAEELAGFAADKGLQFENLQSDVADKQARGDVRWEYVTLRKPA